MAQFRVRKHEDCYEVLYPNGKVKCRVKDGALAYQIATELIHDRPYQPSPVRCVEKDLVFKDHIAAAKALGGYAAGIKKCCLGLIAKSGGYTWEFADAV